MLGTADDVRVLRIAASGVGLDLGDGLVVISGGTLALEKTTAGLAGVVRATITSGPAGSALDGIFSVGATVTVMINQRATAATFDRAWLVERAGPPPTSTPSSETVAHDARPSGRRPYLRVEAAGHLRRRARRRAFRGLADRRLRLPSRRRRRGRRTPATPRERSCASGSPTIISFWFPGVLAHQRRRGLLLLTPRRPGGVDRGHAGLRPVRVPFTGTFRIASIRSQNRTLPLPSTSRSSSVARCSRSTCRPGPTSSGRQDIELLVAGALLLRGDFSIENGRNDVTTDLKVTLRQVELRLGDGTTDYVVVTEGTARAVPRRRIRPRSYAGLQATSRPRSPSTSPASSSAARSRSSINTTRRRVNETFHVGDGTR